MSPYRRFVRFWGSVRNETLLVFILILLGLDVVQTNPTSGLNVILRVVSWLFVLGGLVFACSRSRAHVIQLVLLIVPGGALMFLYLGEPIPPSPVPLLISSVLTAAALLLVSFRIVQGIMRTKVVRADTVAGSLCVYLLMALAWSFIYTFLYIRDPGSFQSVAAPLDPAGHTPRELQRELTYFSFVTITTLGYGDITPASMSAKTLSYLEAVIGQLYLIALVSRLVALHVAHQFERD